MAVLIFWVVFSFFAAAIAEKKGRSAVGFFFLALLLSPLIGIIAALIAEPNKKEVETAAVHSGKAVKCPFCAELIKPEAVVCRFCGRDVAAKSAAPPPTVRKPRPALPIEPPLRACDVRFSCGTCGQPLAAEGLQIGRRVKCPRCTSGVQVPSVSTR